MQVKCWLQSLKLRTFQLMHNILRIVCNIITVDKYSELFSAESFVFQFAIQKFKDQDI